MPKKESVFVVVYNDLEYGEVNVDVFSSRADALGQLAKTCESCEKETIYDKHIEKTTTSLAIWTILQRSFKMMRRSTNASFAKK